MFTYDSTAKMKWRVCHTQFTDKISTMEMLFYRLFYTTIKAQISNKTIRKNLQTMTNFIVDFFILQVMQLNKHLILGDSLQ